jgi:tetratricopeptide (TPR) repeat protein
MKKICYTTLICCFLAYGLSGQSNQVLFNAEIQSGNIDLQDQQYRSAIKHAEKAKTYVGQDGTTAQIEYIITKSNIGLGYFDDAKISLKRYFNIAKDDDFGYNEMLLLLSQIDDIEEETRKAEEAKKTQVKEEKEAWDRAIKINTSEAYQSFATKFPQSINAIEANKLDNNLKIESQLKIERTVLAQYKSKWKGRVTAKWMLLLGGAAAMTSFFIDYDFNGVFAAGMIATTTGLLFIYPRKYKKRYQKQLNVVNNLEKGLITDSGKISPHWQIGMSAQRPGLTLNFNF